MNTVQIKYDNFKQFLNERVPTNNEMLKRFNAVPLDYFLKTVKDKAQYNEEQCLSEMFKQAGLNRCDFLETDIKRLITYMEYFKMITNVITVQ